MFMMNCIEKYFEEHKFFPLDYPCKNRLHRNIHELIKAVDEVLFETKINI